MRFRLPQECAGIVHAGAPLPIGADHTVEAEEGAAAALAAHGLRPAGEPEPPREAETKPRPRGGRRGGGA